VEIRDRLVAAVREHAAGAPQADDITVVIVKRD
jgi:serine phosphatase RsbU (regulator of sigma subunit)